MEPTSFDVSLQRLLVQCKDGQVTTISEVGSKEEIREPLGMITHGWERTTEDGEVAISEFITDTGFLTRDDRIIQESGTSTVVNLPQRTAEENTIIALAEAAGGGGILRRGDLSDRRCRFLINNAATVANDLNRIFRQVVTERWIGWYSAEGIAYGSNGVYDIDFANESNSMLCDAISSEFKQKVIDQTRLAADQADVILEVLPSTIDVKVDVFVDGNQIL